MTQAQESLAEDAVTPSEPAPGWHTLATVVMPEDGDEDTLALYVDQGSAVLPQAEGEIGEGRGAEEVYVSVPPTGSGLNSHDVLSRHSCRIRPGDRKSFATYFNAFPAGYWRHWTDVRTIRLVTELSGAATVYVYRSTSSGRIQRMASERVSGNGIRCEFMLDLTPFADGGWYWFDIVAGDAGAVLDAARWETEQAPVRTGSLTIGTTTFNRTALCLQTVQAMGRAAEVRERLDRFYVIDQGSAKVSDEPGWADAAAVLGDQLQLIEQPNLGGSGGFARGMYESTKAGRATYHLVLDDDVSIEPEGIMRALRFADYCRVPTIVGGHMFDLHERSVLHAYGEAIDPVRWFWGPAPGLDYGHDFRRKSLRTTTWLHHRYDVDYNGWWMCLIPTQIIRELGLSLPVFIKWDDAEYGLRAGRAGYPTVSLPGAAVWHFAWADKQDLIDWQAYYHERNRLVTALLYSPRKRGGTLLEALVLRDVKHGISMQYYAQAARIKAMQDVLKGPAHLHATIAETLPQLRSMTQDFVDSQFLPDAEAFPAPGGRGPLRRGDSEMLPSVKDIVPLVVSVGVRQFRKVKPSAAERPEARIPYYRAKAWVVSQYDSVVIGKADGTGASWYRRDPKLFRDQARTIARLRRELIARWDELATAYRNELSTYTSPAAWEKTFGINGS